MKPRGGRTEQCLYRSAGTRGGRVAQQSFIVTAVVLSMLLLTVTGCVASSPPPDAKQEVGKKDSTEIGRASCRERVCVPV